MGSGTKKSLFVRPCDGKSVHAQCSLEESSEIKVQTYLNRVRPQFSSVKTRTFNWLTVEVT